jgi:nitroreductase
VNPNKIAATSAPIHDVIARRWSGRAFDRDKPVSREQLKALLEAARWAPSCFNDQPWRYLVWDRFHNEHAWQTGFSCLTEWNQSWVKNAPLLLLSVADSEFSKTGKPNRWGPYDTGAASAGLCLQAATMGLMAHQMGGFDARKIHRILAVPERYTCMAMIAVGHPASADVLNPELRELELAARERRPLNEFCFDGEWGVPLPT